MSEVGRVLGKDDAHPLDFWVGVGEDSYLQLDDVISVKTEVPGRGDVTLYGIVDMVRARHEGARFDSDVFLEAEAVLPLGVSTAAHVAVTRIEPEVFVPPHPGNEVARVAAAELEKALYFDRMEHRFVAGQTREGQKIFGNLDFLDGSRGAHVNISGISGVATKTSCALFLLYSLFHSDALGMQRANARAVIFNVKGDDLMFVDKPNGRLAAEEEKKYEHLGLPCGPFQDVALWSPVSKEGFEIVHALGSRQEGVTPYLWTVREFCQEGLLRFLFADADTETSQLSFAVTVAERHLAYETRNTPKSQSWAQIGDARITNFDELADYITDNVDAVFARGNVAEGTRGAFLRRMNAAAARAGHLIRRTDSKEEEDRYRIDWMKRQLNVIDIR